MTLSIDALRARLRELLARAEDPRHARDPRLFAAIGEAYLLLGLTPEGERAFAHALALDADHVPALAGLAQVFLARGRIGEAEALFGRWFRLEPDARAIAGIARCRQRRRDDPGALRVLQAFAAEVGLAPETAALFAESATRLGYPEDALAVAVDQLRDPPHPELLHAMGDAFDALGRTDEAFEAWDAANRARGLPWDPEAHRAEVEGRIRTFSAAALARLPRASAVDERPVFIVGVPRSGTSLVEQILASHPDVHARGELDLVPRLSLHLPERLGRRAGEDWLDAVRASVLDEVAVDALASLTAPAGDARRVTDKLPHNLFHLGLIALLFPGAWVIRCVRDPLDTGLSCFRTRLGASHGWATSLPGLAGFLEDAERMAAHWRRVLTLPMLDLRYEDLVERPEPTVRQLLDFLQLPWHPACLHPERSERVVATASFAQARAPIHRGSVGRAAAYAGHLAPLLPLRAA